MKENEANTPLYLTPTLHFLAQRAVAGMEGLPAECRLGGTLSDPEWRGVVYYMFLCKTGQARCAQGKICGSQHIIYINFLTSPSFSLTFLPITHRRPAAWKLSESKFYLFLFPCMTY